MTWQTRPGGHLWLWILTSSFVAGLFLPGVRRWVHSLALTGQFGASTVAWECLLASPTAHVPLMYQWDTNVDGVSSVFQFVQCFPCHLIRTGTWSSLYNHVFVTDEESRAWRQPPSCPEWTWVLAYVGGTGAHSAHSDMVTPFLASSFFCLSTHLRHIEYLPLLALIRWQRLKMKL